MTDQQKERATTLPETDSEVTDGHGSPGMVEGQGAGGLATGLQPGGTVPGGGPGNSVGSIGTGGGSNQDRDTGSLKRWDEGQHEESGQ